MSSDKCNISESQKKNNSVTHAKRIRGGVGITETDKYKNFYLFCNLCKVIELKFQLILKLKQ